MKKTLTYRLRACFISAAVLLAGYAVVKACADGDWDDSYNSNITPETFVDPAYTPFFYSYLFYYNINFDNDHDQRFNETNANEWQSYLGKELPRGTLDWYLTTAGYETIKSTRDYYEGKESLPALPDSVKKFNAVFNGGSPKQRSFFRYLTTAKACESFAVNDVRYSWEYDEPRKTTPVPDGVTAADIEKEWKQEQDAFLKERYWFQLVRYYFFNDQQACIAAFENNRQQYKPTVMYYRTMAYAAGAYYKQKNYGKANYYYSLVFAGNDALKVVAHWSFHPQEEKDWQQTLAMCANNKERITLWQMLGVFYGDEMRSMQEIYKLAPSDNRMDLLLTRLINKLEQNYNSKPKDQDTYLAWCRKVTDENKVSNPFLWNVSTGYLAFLENDYATAGKYYAQAAKRMPATALAKDQLHLLQLLNKVEALNHITASDEQSLVPEFNWLYALNSEKNPGAFRYSRAQGSIKDVMAKKYRAQGDIVKAECFVSTAGFYASDKNVNDLKAFLTKSNPTAFEQLCRKFSAKSTDDLWEYQAVQATFKDDLEQAITFMGNAGKQKEVVLAGNPFNGKIADCHDCDHAQKQKVKYSRLDFLQKMKEMKNNITGGKDAYNNALLLANGYYNITHFGNARYFYEGQVIGEGHSTPYDIDSVFKPMLTDNSLATKYYRVALQNAADDEQKAKCLYMLAKCQRNDWYNKTFFSDIRNDPSWGNNSNVDFITWNAFSAMRKYKNTQYYKDVIRECGYFRTAMQK